MAKTIECPSCGNIYFDNEERCSYCGAPQPHSQSKDLTEVYNQQEQKHEEEQKRQENQHQGQYKNSQPFNLQNVDWVIVVILLIVFWPAALIYFLVKATKK